MGASDFDNLNQTVNTQPNNQSDPNPIPQPDSGSQPVEQNASAPEPVSSTDIDQGSGPNGPMPDELRQWSWAASLGSWLWGISQKVWISLVSTSLLVLTLIASNVLYYNGHIESSLGLNILFILGLGLFVAVHIFLGINGNELAWNSRKYRDIAHFKKIQIFWAIMGIFIAIAQLIAILMLYVSLSNWYIL